MKPTWVRFSRAEFTVDGKAGLCIIEGMTEFGQIVSQRVTNQAGEISAELSRLHALGAHDVLVGRPLDKLPPVVKLPDDDAEEKSDHNAPGTLRKYHKPPTTWVRSPKFSSRNGSKIDTIVLHYTFTRNTESAVATLTTGERVASAHYVIGRDGKCFQLVKDSDKAWHAPKVNSRSIGIEHVAMPGERLAIEQEKTSVALLKYLMSEYHIPASGITGHKYTGQATQCPANLFGPASTQEELKAWVKLHLKDVTPLV